jgi:hypothetical protein
MSAMLDEATSENVRHLEACRHAASLSEMLSDVTRHELDMNALVTQMTEASGQMRTDTTKGQSCSGPALDQMSQALTDTKAEMALHAKRMLAVDNLGAGQYECAVHSSELRKKLASMTDDMGSMSCVVR